MKRGQIEVQFNWIFILIAGALILALFFAIVNTQRKTSEHKISIAVKDQLDKILSGTSVIGGTVKSLDLLNFDIKSECDSIFVGDAKAAIAITHRPIFAPDTITGQRVLLWSQDWNTPFRTTTFLYATSTAARYLFVKGSSAFSQKLFSDLPDEMTKELLDGKGDISSLQDNDNYKIRIVMFDEPSISINMPTWMRNMDDNEVTLLNVKQSLHEVDYYQKSTSNFVLKGTTSYTDNPTLYGAIFSESAETYNCLINTKALMKLKTVSKIYADRTKSLADYYSTQASICQGFYVSAGSSISEVRGFAASGFPGPSIGDFISAQSDLADINRRALSESCEPIY